MTRKRPVLSMDDSTSYSVIARVLKNVNKTGERSKIAHRSILSIVVGCCRIVCCPVISTTHCVPSSRSVMRKIYQSRLMLEVATNFRVTWIYRFSRAYYGSDKFPSFFPIAPDLISVSHSIRDNFALYFCNSY